MDSNGPQGGVIRDARFRSVEGAPSATRKSSAGGWIIAIVMIAALGLGAYFFWFRPKSTATDATATAGSRGGGGGREVPVVAVPAKQGDLPIYLNGLGTITPFNLAVVRSRVGGEIINVAFKEGQDVKEGDLLAEIDPRPFEVQLEQAKGQLARDQAVLNNAKADLDRYQSAGTSVAQQQIDTAAAQVRQYEAVVESDNAGIHSAELNLTYCRITAPFTGRIGLRRVDVGNIVMANDPNGLAVVTQITPIALMFTIPQDDAPAVFKKADGGVGLQVDAFDRGFVNQLASGKIDAIDNQIDPTTGTIRIKARFENKDRLLLPNQFVNARLLVDTLLKATLVPTAAVQRGPDNQFVYVVKQDQTVEVRPVTLGPTTDDLTEIDTGVKPGEVVVTDGVDKLFPGAKVAVREGGRRNAATKPSGSTTKPSTPQSTT